MWKSHICKYVNAYKDSDDNLLTFIHWRRAVHGQWTWSPQTVQRYGSQPGGTKSPRNPACGLSSAGFHSHTAELINELSASSLKSGGGRMYIWASFPVGWQNTSSDCALAGKEPLKGTRWLRKSSLFAFSWLKFTRRKVLQLYKGTIWHRGCCPYFLHKNWVNRGINAPVSQLTVWRCVMFTFLLVPHIVVNTVVSRDCVVAMVAVLISVVVQLCVLHWPLLRGTQSPQHMYSTVAWDESKMSTGSKTNIQL